MIFILNEVKIFYSFLINENQVKVVSEFKLLGIIIDDKLNFNAYASKIRKALNIRLYSIQKLFQLPIAVKIQTTILSLYLTLRVKYKLKIICSVVHVRERIV
jgi:hypothetical protein